MAEEKENLYSKEILELISARKELSKTRHNVSIGILAKLVDELIDTRQELIKHEDDKEYFDGSLGETIGDALTKMSESLIQLIKSQQPQKIDFTVLSRAITESNDNISEIVDSVNKQNLQIIDLLTKVATPQAPDNSAVEELIKQLPKLIANNSSIVDRSIKSIDNTEQFKAIAVAIAERPREWEFTVEREYNRINKIKAKAV
jgi:hypothetical protein